MDMLPIVARLGAQKITQVAGSDVFAVPAGWQGAALVAEAGMAVTATPAAFEAALADDTVTAVFVPAHAFGLALIERLLNRSGVSRTIFLEQGNG